MTDSIREESLPGLLAAALAALKAKKAEIDRLNVYPVPDGDTGTNMVLTMENVCSEVTSAGPDLKSISEAAKYGSLMGARGNSGVILSQMIRGFFEAIEDRRELSVADFIAGLQNATRVSYQAVKKPVEGTMLTVLRETAQAVADVPGEGMDVEDVLAIASRAAEESVGRTPELLPILKESGVVDAGGYGLAVMLRGILDAARGEPTAAGDEGEIGVSAVNFETGLEFAYCTEMVLKGNDLDKGALEKKIEHLGDSMLVVGTPEVLKIHIHTNNPGLVLESATAMGSLGHVQINNMVEQAAERSKQLAEENEAVGVVAVAAGGGVREIFKSLGVEGFVEGGQSMNPSTAEILEAVKALPHRRAIILPNNKNIILAAQQVNEVTDKEVVTLPTKSVPEGLAAMLGYDPGSTLEENEANMLDSFSEVRSGEVTVAVRDANGVRQGDFIGLTGGAIAASSGSLLETTMALMASMADGGETATILAGSDVTEEDVNVLLEEFAERHPKMEIELHRGDQPIYHFLIGVE
ncbi:MAG: DAK2 domain-containing protein [Candidatus Aquicultorales bacterium]